MPSASPPDRTGTPLREKLSGYSWGAIVPFFLLHVGAVAAFFHPITWKLVLLAAVTYLVRMFGITAGYHRYFSHRSFKLGRVNQFLLAFLAQSSAQKGVLWWAAHHREHHQNSDLPEDIHSPRQHGFWWSHMGWVVSNEYDGHDPRLIQDYGKYPELRWLNRYHWVPTALLGAAIAFVGGWAAFLWGYVLSTVVLYHCTYTINSLAHVWGTRRFETADDSRNNFFLALITLGEGWHNNHHRFMYACRQGLRWWEIDCTYYALKVLSWFKIVRGIRAPRLDAEALSPDPMPSEAAS